jgi:hypothetical protein
VPRLGVLGGIPAHKVEAKAAEPHVILEPSQPLLERVAQVGVAVVQVPRTGAAAVGGVSIVCIRRHQTFALAPIIKRERRFRVYKEAPCFRPGLVATSR